MAAPESITLKDLTGDWIMNKTLSDSVDPILTLQGISWFLRKAISLATITLHIKEYEADDNDDGKTITHIDLEQTATGGIKGTTELRTLDWVTRLHADHIFGKLDSRSRWVVVEGDQVEDEFLKKGWAESGRGDEGCLVQAWAKSRERDWVVDQIWGFEEINGLRYHTRHVVLTTSTERKQARLVYDYVPKE